MLRQNILSSRKKCKIHKATKVNSRTNRISMKRKYLDLAIKGRIIHSNSISKQEKGVQIIATKSNQTKMAAY